MTRLVAFLKDDTGASAAEYVLILAIIGSAIVVAAGALGGAISGALNSAATYITAHSAFS